MVVFGVSGCVRAKVVLFRQKRLYSWKTGHIRAEWLYSGKSCCIRETGCNRAKMVVYG